MSTIKSLKFLYAFVGLLFLIFFPLLDNRPYHLDLGIIIGIHAIVAMALNILLGNSGQVSLGQAAFFGVGAYASSILNVNFGVNVWVTLVMAPALAGIIGFLLGFTALRSTGLHLALVTMGFQVIFSIILSEWTSLTGGTAGFSGMRSPAIGSFIFDTEMRYFYLVWLFVVVLLIFGKNIISMRIGRSLSAIRLNEIVASTFGVNPAKYKLGIFTLSGVYAGIAGWLYAHYSLTIGPSPFGLRFSLILLCMITSGGIRRGVWGGICGAAFINLLPEFLRSISSLVYPSSGGVSLDYSYNLIGFGILILIFLRYLPDGIAGSVGSLSERMENFLSTRVFRFSTMKKFRTEEDR